MSKPVVFVSSTINDFKDIRNSIKFWLEEKGFIVLLSEAQDLERNPTLFTIESCLQLVRTCDIYILLVGDYSGWTPPGETNTITHLEYLEANKVENKATHIFAKKDVIERFKNNDQTLSTFPLLTDVYSHKGKNGTNWVNCFENFSDIATTVKSTLGISKSISKKALEQMLMKELEEFLLSATLKIDNILKRPCDIAYELVQRLNLSKQDFMKDMNNYNVILTRNDFRDLTYLNFAFLHPRLSVHPAIELASSSEHFIKYDIHTGNIELTETIATLQGLSSNLKFITDDVNIQKLNKWMQSNVEVFAQNFANGKSKIKALDVILPLGFYIRFSRAYLEAESIYNNLKHNDDINSPSMKTFVNTVFKIDTSNKEDESILATDLEAIRAFVKKNNRT